MAKVSYIQRRGGVYYFRHPVPKHLKKFLGKGELIYSLKAYCYDDAKVKGLFLAQMAKKIFQIVSNIRRTLSDQEAKDIVRAYFREGILEMDRMLEYERNLRDVDIHDFDPSIGQELLKRTESDFDGEYLIPVTMRDELLEQGTQEPCDAPQVCGWLCEEHNLDLVV